MNDQLITVADGDQRIRDLNEALQNDLDVREAERAAAVEKEMNRDVPGMRR